MNPHIEGATYDNITVNFAKSERAVHLHTYITSIEHTEAYAKSLGQGNLVSISRTPTTNDTMTHGMINGGLDNNRMYCNVLEVWGGNKQLGGQWPKRLSYCPRCFYPRRVRPPFVKA